MYTYEQSLSSGKDGRSILPKLEGGQCRLRQFSSPWTRNPARPEVSKDLMMDRIEDSSLLEVIVACFEIDRPGILLQEGVTEEAMDLFFVHG